MLATYFSNPPAPLASDVFHKEPKALHLASDGPFGKFDKRQLQRGFQVYSEVCSACHSLKLVSFRDLKELGYNEAEIKKIASRLEDPGARRSTRTPASRRRARRCRPTTSRRRSRTKSRRARPTTMRFRPTCR